MSGAVLVSLALRGSIKTFRSSRVAGHAWQALGVQAAHLSASPCAVDFYQTEPGIAFCKPLTQAVQVKITAQEPCSREGECEEHGCYAYNGTVCVPCPGEGASCHDGEIKLKEGFWYDRAYGPLADFWYKRHRGLVSQEVKVYRCPQFDRCLVEEDTGLPVCKTHHQGPMCSVCDPGYYFVGFKGCKVCPPDSQNAASAVAFVIALVIAYKGGKRLWRNTVQKYPEADLQRFLYQGPQMFKLVAGAAQVIASFQESFNAVRWPDSYRDAIAWFAGVFSFDLFGTPIFACQAAGDTYQKRFMWHTCGTALVTFALVIAFGFLFNAYHHRFFYFESVMTIYKLSMTTLVVFIEGADGPKGTALKILYSMFVSTCLIAVVAFLQPYKDKVVLSVATMVNLEVLFVLFAARYLQASKSNSIFVGIGLILMLLSPVLLCFSIMGRGAHEEIKEAAHEEDAAPGLGTQSQSKRKKLKRQDTFTNTNPMSTFFLSQRNVNATEASPTAAASLRTRKKPVLNTLPGSLAEGTDDDDDEHLEL
eukprot:g5886.t1